LNKERFIMRRLVLGMLLVGLVAGCNEDGASEQPPVTEPQTDAGLEAEPAPDAEAGSQDAQVPDAQPEAGTYPCGTKPPTPDDRLLPSDVSTGAPDVELRTGSERIELMRRSRLR